jgi:hypothetical protein
MEKENFKKLSVSLMKEKANYNRPLYFFRKRQDNEDTGTKKQLGGRWFSHSDYTCMLILSKGNHRSNTESLDYARLF